MADVTVESNIHTTFVDGSDRLLVAVSSTVLYAFLIDNTSSDLVYRKSTDGGASWGSQVTVRTGTLSSVPIITCWFDKWTPGNSGTLIHIFYYDSLSLRYDSLDTSSDTLSGSVLVVSGALLPVFISCTRSVGGNLYVVAGTSNGSHYYRSTAVGASASFSVRTSPMESSTTDYCKLFPANLADTNDIWGLYWDTSANEISLKTGDDSANNWTGAGAEASIGTSMTEASLSEGGFTGFTGTIRHSDGHLLVAAWNEQDTATAGTADLKTWDITNGSTITAKTDVLTNVFDQYGAALYCDNNTGDVYCFYLGNGSGDDWDATVSVNYKKSTDGMATWGSQQAYSQSTTDDYRNLWCDLGAQAGQGGVVAALWSDDDDNDLFINATNAISISGSVSVTITSVVSAATSDGNAASILYDWIFASSFATADLVGNIPNVGITALVEAIVAAAGLDVLTSFTLYDYVIAGSTATLTAAGEVPALLYDYLIGSTTALLTSDGLVSSISLGATILTEIATAVLNGESSSTAFDYVITGELATASLSGLVSSLLYDYVIESVQATLTGDGLSATISLGATVLAEIAQAVLSGESPSTALDWIISSALATSLAEVLESSLLVEYAAIIEAVTAELTAAVLSGLITADRSIVIEILSPAHATVGGLLITVNQISVEDLITTSYLFNKRRTRPSRHVGRSRQRERY